MHNMTSRKNHIPRVTEQVFQMPFALWDISHPFQNTAQSVKKFVLQSRQTYLLFLTLLPSLDTSLAVQERFQKRVCYVFSKVSDSSVPAIFSNSFIQYRFIISIHLNPGNRKSLAFKLPIKSKNTLSTTVFANIKNTQICFLLLPSTERDYFK